MASSNFIPSPSVTISDIMEVLAIADAQPKVCHLHSLIQSSSSEHLIHIFIISPHAGEPTIPTASYSYPSASSFE